MSDPKKIAIIVPNTCNPDYRVIKQAQALSDCGHEVHVFCRLKRGLPKQECINGVTYNRISFSFTFAMKFPFILKSFLFSFFDKSVRSESRLSLSLPESRDENIKLFYDTIGQESIEK